MAAASSIITSKISRADFGDDFIFGTAVSAYQVEGAAAEGGRGPSIWDTFTNQTPERVEDGSTGNVAVDQYHLFKEDVQIMKKIGLDAYRFSISWSRVLPGGRLNGGVNREGIAYYNNLINELLANGIQPFVTLFHWDVPQALESEYGGFLSRSIVDDFREFVELCYWEFGDRVKNWVTLNEPWTFAVQGYTYGEIAPGRGATTTTSHQCSEDDEIPYHRGYIVYPEKPCKSGDPSTEPYLVAHNLLLAHAQAVKSYRQKFKVQGGKIGISLVSQWWEPFENTQEDEEAFERIADFFFGWFMSPITYGDYPKRMRDILQSRLPEFSAEESQALKGSFDFLGLNYYTGRYVTNKTVTRSSDVLDYYVDTHVTTPVVASDTKTEIGPRGASEWLYIYPVGIYKLLNYVKSRYEDPVIYITENGLDEANDVRLTVSQSLVDDTRIQYHHHHLAYVKQAMDIDKVKIKGYFIWSLLDNFEWAEGFTVRFGIIYVNYRDKYARIPKESALWFMNFLHATQNVTADLLLPPRPPPASRGTKRAKLDEGDSGSEFVAQN